MFSCFPSFKSKLDHYLIWHVRNHKITFWRQIKINVYPTAGCPIILATTVNVYTPATSLENHPNCHVVSARLSSTVKGHIYAEYLTQHISCMNVFFGCVKFKVSSGVRPPTVTGPHFCRIQMFSLFLELKKKKSEEECCVYF